MIYKPLIEFLLSYYPNIEDMKKVAI